MSVWSGSSEYKNEMRKRVAARLSNNSFACDVNLGDDRAPVTFDTKTKPL